MTDGHIVQPGKVEATENGGDSRAGAVAGLVILWPVWAGGGLSTTPSPPFMYSFEKGLSTVETSKVFRLSWGLQGMLRLG